MAVGSINITDNPVAGTEQYLLTATDSGMGEAHFQKYSEVDRAEGGFWSCSFTLFSRSNLLKDLFENGLGRHVEAWGYGLQQDFEGYIHEMVYTLPPDKFTITIENMANKMFMRADYDDDAVVERTTTLTNADSDARFGTKEIVISGGEVEGLTVADQAVQTFLDLRGFPKPEASLGGGRGEESLEIFCRGYIHTLGWRTYNQTALTGTQGASAQIKDILDAAGEFVDSYTLESNSTVVTKEYDADRRPLDIIQNIVGLGDANNNRWVLYMIGKTATQTKGRRVLLKQAAPSVVTVVS